MKAVLIFDADNTLWDTDSVFRFAQLSLLKTLEKFHLLIEPEEQLSTLRMIDRELFEQMGRFEYDFKVLSIAITYYFANQLSFKDIKDVVCHAIFDSKKNITSNSELTTVIAEAYSAYSKGLREIPKLYPDTETILRSICNPRNGEKLLTTMLLSEGDAERLERILKTYKSMRQLFDQIFIDVTKNKETLEKVKDTAWRHLSEVQVSQETLFILIGDSLKRDIKFGNQVGFITIYKPSPFMGQEKPQSSDEKPHYTIQRLRELPVLLSNLGLPIEV